MTENAALALTALPLLAALSLAPKDHDGARDFDFLVGRWTIHNRRLKDRLKGSTEWIEFASSNEARLLPGGLGNEDVYRTDWAGGFVGMTFRFYDPKTRLWSLHWADSRRGTLDPPVVGAFHGETGVFEGDDTWEGTPIRVRFVWSRKDADAPRWEQAFSTDGGKTWETNWIMEFRRETASPRGADLRVLELRRYVTKEGGRDRFARRFDAWAPEAFQQLGAVVVGQFTERDRPRGFTWIRGWTSMDARAVGMPAFYDGPVWREHKADLNALLDDSDDVLLLHPFREDDGVPLLASIDPANREAARGAVVAQVLAVAPGRVEECAARAEKTFASYRAAGARPAGLLTTLDAPNNYPRHPIRADGPFLVWLGVVRDDDALARVRRAAEDATPELRAGGLLRTAPELVVLDPTERSRLRWLGD